MSDYAKMKNAELEALLKQRSLPHTGKKAEMVARLQEDDKKQTSNAPAGAAKEDEIDWDDDVAEPSKVKPAAASSAGAKTAADAAMTKAETNPKEAAAKGVDGSGAAIPLAASNGSKPEASSTALAPSNEAKPEDDGKPATDYSIGLPEATLDEEIERRKARAKKFGMQDNDPLAEEAMQRLARAKKFGEAAGPTGLNAALPERREKRRRDGDEHGRQDFKRRGRGGRRQGPRGDGGQRHNDGSRSGWMSEQDKSAAEARKARFAATA